MESSLLKLKKQILDLTDKYVKLSTKHPKYKKGDRIQYAGIIHDKDEVRNLIDVSLDMQVVIGKYINLFQHDLEKFLNVKHSLFVNSGSSANLLAFMALTSPLLKDRAVKKGDEVITVAAGFPTTISPIIQYGAVPVFVDVTLPQYNIDISTLQKALSKKTKAVMLAHTLGNPFNVKAVRDFCAKNNLWFIEDNCDALGSKYKLNGTWQYTGTFGDIATSSFYPAHHITTGEGGAVYTNNHLLYKILLSLRDWGRDCVCTPGIDNLCGHRFDNQYGQLPKGYDHKYVYSHFGYNLKATNLQAAVGQAQLKKLTTFVKKRQANWQYLYDNLKDLSDVLVLPEPEKSSLPSWFGFLITLKDGVKISRNEIVALLEEKKIQTRMLFAGNLIKHPCFDSIRNDKKSYRVVGSLKNTDRIMNNTFWVGVYPAMTKEMIKYMADTIRKIVRS